MEICVIVDYEYIGEGFGFLQQRVKRKRRTKIRALVASLMLILDFFSQWQHLIRKMFNIEILTDWDVEKYIEDNILTNI